VLRAAWAVGDDGAADHCRERHEVDAIPWRPIIVAVQPESLEVLENANVPPAQARAIVRAIEIEIGGAKDSLTTKHDLLLLRSDLRQETADLGSDLRQEMADLRSDLRQEITDLRSDVRQEMADLRGELKAEIHGSASSVTRQMYAALLGQMAVLLGFAYFFATHVR
jgi:hypothetical protein